ncbi:uncharacterized protein LOC110713968 isoform X1 [Chenopodium quinoa]|uniref:uncharacterized protein LOC110713968 isoform X1 n=1 Tax=Chenopodium quinoa TaxID=63459 RepID=UPI000B78A38D|nr:uncharacterized protein LOC110713968 isoform X1 [Chenopodium quinoa]
MKVQYLIPSNLNLSLTSSHSAPLLKMDVETADKIHVTVTDILNSSDSDSLTEKQIRHLASLKLNLDLSDLPHKFFIRQIIESFLRSSDHPQNDTVLPPNLPSTSINEPLKETPLPHSESKLFDSCRVICKLSQKRDLAVRNSGGRTVVSIGELSMKDGKAIPTPNKCINLFPDQWSLLRKGIPAVDEAIIEAESKIRSELESKQGFDKLDTSAYRNKQNGGEHFGQSGAESTKKDGAYHRTRLMAAREHTQDTSTVASTPLRLVPIEVIRFDGKNYQQWADRMELYLNQLKVAYVLSEPCPSGLGVADKNIAQTLSAAERWMDDDHICRQNILNSLCDNLLRHYSEKSGTAKDLWEELKLVYLQEEHGAKVSLVKKYIDFQITEENSIFEQVHEFHQIADALIASGMYVEEKFHMNVIISKLPPSWKPFSIQLMKEDNLPVWMLMNQLKAEEESRQKGHKGNTLVPRADFPVLQPHKKFGPQKIPMKKPGVPHASPEADGVKKFKFCNICKKRGHYMEQCWFRKTEGMDNANVKDSVTSTNVVVGSNGADKDGAVGDSTN